MPSIGLVKMQDAEIRKEQWIDTSNSVVRNNYANIGGNEKINQMFAKCGVDNVLVSTSDDYVKALNVDV